MSNILKSTKLDIALVKPYFKTICFTLLLPIVFAAINRSLLTGVSFAMCFIAMTTGYTFSITEKNSMDRLFGILPVRKSELVIGRYVFVLAMGLLSLIISLIAQPLVLKVLGETVGVFDIVTAAIAGVFLFALLYCVPDSGILQVRLNQRTGIYVYSSGRFFGDFTSSL